MPLHVTNGDEAADRIRRSRLVGEVLAWRDVLHEGPVPAGLALEELSRVRARFLAGCPWGLSERQLLGDFDRRDRALERFHEQEEVVLWFEHDLYDQLQLLQLLDWFAGAERGDTELSLIAIDRFPGVEPFHGLGQLRPGQIERLYPERRPVSAEALALGRRAWAAFRAEDPGGLVTLLGEGLDALPFLRATIERLLEEYPGDGDGLARSERQLLETLARGVRRLGEAFRASQIEAEERPFMADLPFLLLVEALRRGLAPLVRFADGGPLEAAGQGGATPWRRELELTARGRRVLDGLADRVALHGIDRWLGGVHLEGRSVRWRWSRERRALVGA